jgi:hypothetical protein
MLNHMSSMIAAADVVAPHHHYALMVAGIIFGCLIVWALVLTFWWGVNALLKRQTDWDDLAQRFPAEEVHKLGGRYKRRDGFFGRGRRLALKGMFLIELAQEGVLVTASFARPAPILIPWSAIRHVSETRLGGMYSAVLMSVKYDREVKFHLPDEALAAMGQKVPAEHLDQSPSLVGLIKSRSGPVHS